MTTEKMVKLVQVQIDGYWVTKATYQMRDNGYAIDCRQTWEAKGYAARIINGWPL